MLDESPTDVTRLERYIASQNIHEEVPGPGTPVGTGTAVSLMMALGVSVL